MQLRQFVPKVLPNGVKDEISVDANGQWQKVQRIGQTIIGGNADVTFGGNYTGYKSIGLSINGMANAGDFGFMLYKSAEQRLTNINADTSASFTGVDQCFQISSNGSLRLSVSTTDSGWADEYTPTSTEMKNYFATHNYVLSYQLAVPKLYMSQYLQ